MEQRGENEGGSDGVPVGVGDLAGGRARQNPRLTMDRRIDRDRRVWELRMGGNTYEEIGREVGISKQHVSRLLARIRAEAVRELALDVEENRAELVRAHLRIFGDAMRAYEASCAAGSRVMTTGRAMVDRAGEVVRLPDEVVEHSPAPNAFMLQAASRQLEAIARLYGVAVDRSEVLHRSEPIKLYSGFDPEEV